MIANTKEFDQKVWWSKCHFILVETIWLINNLWLAHQVNWITEWVLLTETAPPSKFLSRYCDIMSSDEEKVDIQISTKGVANIWFSTNVCCLCFVFIFFRKVCKFKLNSTFQLCLIQSQSGQSVYPVNALARLGLYDFTG